MYFGGGLFIVAYTILWSEIPKGKTLHLFMRSVLAVTIRSINVLVVCVSLGLGFTTFCILNVSKIERSFLALVHCSDSVLKSQVKSPSSTILDVFSQAFSKVALIRSMNSLVSGGL